MTSLDLVPVLRLRPGTKLPADKGWPDTPVGKYQPVGHHGRLAADGFLFLDLDLRHFPAGRDVRKDLLDAFPSIASTYTVKSPEGWHYYLTIPPGKLLCQHQPAWPGIDFQANRRQVVGAGSKTEKGEYVVYNENDGVLAPAPADFLTTCIGEPVRVPRDSGVGLTLSMQDQFRRECEFDWPVAIAGQRGGNMTYALAARGREYGLEELTVYATLVQFYNPRCQPMWTEAEIHTQVESAFKSKKISDGMLTPEAIFKGSVAPPPGARDDIKADANPAHFQKGVRGRVDKSGEFIPANTQGNALVALRTQPIIAGKIFYNQFADRLEVKDSHNWLGEDGALNKISLAKIQSWFSEQCRLERSTSSIEAACYSEATQYHPVLDYLEGLAWDGVRRLDTLLPDTTGCADNAFTRAASACLLISAVKRIYEPGCKQDYVLVLESKEGTKKSTWVKILGGDWASVGELTEGSKDTYITLLGKWIVELPEVDATFSKAHRAWLKKIVSTPDDTYVPKYARLAETIKRQSIFIATLNPNAAGTYLGDGENRRWWPVKTGTFDVEKLRRDRDQYFAEAKSRYFDGENSWITDPKAQQVAAEEQKARKEVDPWIDMLDVWAAAQKEGFTKAAALAALGFSGRDVNTRHETRMSQVLCEMGYSYARSTTGGGKWEKTTLTWRDVL